MRLFILFCVFLPCLVLANDTKQSGSPRYASAWWSSLPEEQKFAYLTGYYDCYVWDEKGLKHLDGPVVDLIKAISNYYTSHPEDKDEEVTKVFLGLNIPKGKEVDGEHYNGRHALYDGEYWRQLFTDEERQEFVRSALVCRKEINTLRFSKSIEDYVERISKWYGVNQDDPSDINAKRADVKISDVLSKFHD